MPLPENSGASKRVTGEIYPVRPTARSIPPSYHTGNEWSKTQTFVVVAS
jgi:hypothetical protein